MRLPSIVQDPEENIRALLSTARREELMQMWCCEETLETLKVLKKAEQARSYSTGIAVARGHTRIAHPYICYLIAPLVPG